MCVLSPAVTASGLGVLSTGPETPVVPETPVKTHLLHALEVVTKAGIEHVGSVVHVLALLVVLLPVEEPRGDHDVGGGADDGDNLVDLVVGQLTGPLGHVDASDLANHGGHTAPDTPDGGQGDGDLLTSINVGVEDTKDVLELVGGGDLDRHLVRDL
ncbi:response regulator [Babesia caballi]|uniref:Response regulator n=1 Tax=Babesia caballi TaxID=5871 RepID=A0AAV4M2J7_BABCB|nr:response regulator [Babesia caballi]